MSLREVRRHVGRLAIVGFTGQTVSNELRELVAEFDLGGVIYFARNVESPQQVAELSRETAALAREWPLWISVDQEGGRVARLRAPFTEWPPAATLGRSGDETLAGRFAAALAAELRAVGVNLDYAPVMDVLTNAANPVIGDRALATCAEDVARLGAAVIRALEDAGVAACAKHFPGHGDTSVDSHEGLPVLDHDRRRLDAIELVPFRRAVAENVAAIMTAHILIPAIDPERPASFAPALVRDLLKHELGYQGVVMSDDLGMKAVSATHDPGEASLAAIAAGCDVVLLCNEPIDAQIRALESLIHAAESGRLPASRIDDAWARQHRVKARMMSRRVLPPVDLNVLGCDAHQGVAREMAAWL